MVFKRYFRLTLKKGVRKANERYYRSFRNLNLALLFKDGNAFFMRRETGNKYPIGSSSELSRILSKDGRLEEISYHLLF